MRICMADRVLMLSHLIAPPPLVHNKVLMKQLIEGGGGCFGFPIDEYHGITAVVRR